MLKESLPSKDTTIPACQVQKKNNSWLWAAFQRVKMISINVLILCIPLAPSTVLNSANMHHPTGSVYVYVCKYVSGSETTVSQSSSLWLPFNKPLRWVGRYGTVLDAITGAEIEALSFLLTAAGSGKKSVLVCIF